MTHHQKLLAARVLAVGIILIGTIPLVACSMYLHYFQKDEPMSVTQIPPAKLESVRKEWEKGLTPLTMLDRGDIVLVVLHKGDDCKTNYHCHRYCKIGGSWVVSVDGQDVYLAMVWAWLTSPTAATVRSAVR